MNDRGQAFLYLAAAAVVLFFGSKLAAKALGRSYLKPKKLACLGDSITAAGYYCNDLASMLNVPSKAFGYPSQGTNAIAAHVDDALDWNPDVVVVLAGVNDLPHSGGADAAISGLTKIYRKLHEAGKKVVAVEITPWHGYHSALGYESNTDKVNAWIRREANVEAVVSTKSLGDYAGRLKEIYSSGDGLHLNREGQAMLAVLINDQAFGG